ncbi:MAG: radical SAM protein [Candidatus Cloacimonetes bacterium]|nr:radical SAM protein [Candidatus Cloacimonadota bacterium]
MPVTRVEVKTVLRRHKLPDSYFVSRFAAAPYRACAHACKYCDGRAEKYWVEGDFERDIVVRANFAEVFEREVRKLRERGIVMFGSGVTDSYQPVEADEGLMRRAAQILLEAELPAMVMTKSALALRDLDLWSELNSRAGFTLLMTIVTLDEDVRRAFEPNASPIQARLDTLRAFKQAGCGVGVMAMPLLPWLGYDPDHLEPLFGAFADIGVDVVLPGGLTLRPGRQKDTFLATLNQFAPELLPRYKELYRENRPSGTPLASVSAERRKECQAILDRLGLNTRLPHRLYRDRLSLADELYVLTGHMHQLFGHHDTKTLTAARNRYRDWLLEHRGYIARRRNLHYSLLDTQLRDEFASGRFRAVLRNDRLFDFLSQRVLHDKTYDYLNRQWGNNV